MTFTFPYRAGLRHELFHVRKYIQQVLPCNEPRILMCIHKVTGTRSYQVYVSDYYSSASVIAMDPQSCTYVS